MLVLLILLAVQDCSKFWVCVKSICEEAHSCGFCVRLFVVELQFWKQLSKASQWEEFSCTGHRLWLLTFQNFPDNVVICSTDSWSSKSVWTTEKTFVEIVLTIYKPHCSWLCWAHISVSPEKKIHWMSLLFYSLCTSAKLLEVQKALSQVKMEIGELTEQVLPGLVQELGELQATSILKGDYELKIARQDYFTSKQDQVSFYCLQQ